MKGMLALAVGIGLATVVGAQQKPAANTGLISPHVTTKGEPTALPVISKTHNDRATTIVYDISGQQSWDSLYDSSNTILQVPIPTGKVMTGIGWDVNIATVGGSWLSEARIYFDGSDRDGYGLFLTPGVADGFAGTGSYQSAVIDLTDNGIPDIPILADGMLWIELFEGYDDVADAVDADWVATSTLTIVYDDPPSPRCAIWTEDFDSGTWPPAGWTVVDNTTNNMSWNTSSYFSRGNLVPGGAGECASIDSDWYGTFEIDGELWTAPFDLPATPTMLEWDMNYQNFAGIDYADVDISTDGGATWTNVVQYNSDLTGHFSADLAPWAGTTGVIVRFHYYFPGPQWLWFWQVDNVALVYEASATWRNAGTNPDSYTVSGPPILDDTFQALIDVGSTGHAFGELWGYAGPLSLTLGGGQTVLIDFTDPNGELLQLAPVAGPIATYDLPVPGDCALFGLGLSTQAVHFGGAPWLLSNAQDWVIGY